MRELADKTEAQYLRTVCQFAAFLGRSRTRPVPRICGTINSTSSITAFLRRDHRTEVLRRGALCDANRIPGGTHTWHAQ